MCVVSTCDVLCVCVVRTEDEEGLSDVKMPVKTVLSELPD